MHLPGIEFVPIVQGAGVMHGQHVAVLGLDGAFFWNAHDVDLQFGDLRAREGSPDQRQNRKHAWKRHR